MNYSIDVIYDYPGTLIDQSDCSTRVATWRQTLCKDVLPSGAFDQASFYSAAANRTGRRRDRG